VQKTLVLCTGRSSETPDFIGFPEFSGYGISTNGVFGGTWRRRAAFPPLFFHFLPNEELVERHGLLQGLPEGVGHLPLLGQPAGALGQRFNIKTASSKVHSCFPSLMPMWKRFAAHETVSTRPRRLFLTFLYRQLYYARKPDGEIGEYANFGRWSSSTRNW
jgi:hypothetical protein